MRGHADQRTSRRLAVALASRAVRSSAPVKQGGGPQISIQLKMVRGLRTV
jgi:hypothetical protein